MLIASQFDFTSTQALIGDPHAADRDRTSMTDRIQYVQCVRRTRLTLDTPRDEIMEDDGDG